MKLLKFTAAALVTALFAALITTSAQAVAVPDFPDVPEGHMFYDAITHLKDGGVVRGYSDGTYGVDKEINRAEFLKIVLETASSDFEGENCFTDVTDQWFAPYVCSAAEMGYVQGYDDGYFRPERMINFAEASKIIVNVLLYGDTDTEGEVWYEKYVDKLGGLYAIPSTILAFDQNITRGEMAEMAFRIDTEEIAKSSTSYENIKNGIVVIEEAFGQELKTFASCSELSGYIADARSRDNAYNKFYALDEVMMEDSAPAPVAEATSGSAKAAEDFSGTNVQVAGVDEADTVKNDGKYIYFVSEGSVKIVDAYPADEMTELASIDFSEAGFYPRELYLDDDKLVVIGDGYVDDFKIAGPSVGFVESMIYYPSRQMSQVHIYDVGDPSDVSLIREIKLDGSYRDSRKVDDMVYIVSNKSNYNTSPDEPIPLLEDSQGPDGEVCGCDDVRYVPGAFETSYMMVVGIPVDDADGEISSQVVLGSSGEVYSSSENMYIAESNYNWTRFSGGSSETAIHKFDLGKYDIDYEGSATVDGTVHDQFSMDENDGYFRVATTSGGWDNQYSNVFVLDNDLDLKGKVTGIAPGEQIYSARYVGDRLYIVTFEQIDPLFVIDLSSPTNPKILGELKIPGVSNYLHPFGDNYLIGFGLDTADLDTIEATGWSWFQGIKMSMFDVSDVAHPVELHKEIIGDRGTTSELNYNHKALLFDYEKGLMAFPVKVAEIPEEVKNDPDLALSGWVYGESTFQGAYVYDVSVDDGFQLRGKISHYDDDQLGDNFSYYYSYAYEKLIERIIYIGENFYTLSDALVQANEMDSLDEVAEVEF